MRCAYRLQEPPLNLTVAVTLAFITAGTAWAEGPPAVDAQYRIGPGDTLQVKVYGERELSGSFPVNDAGELVFPLLGTLTVSGLTASEIDALLTERLGAGFIVDPNVTAWLDAYLSQPVQVLGAVAEPGLYYLKGPTTVLQMLSEAGGVEQEGVTEVRITHSEQEGDVTALPYEQLLASGEGNITLRGGDIVFVPASRVYVMGQVAEPGDIAFHEDLTISTCIAAAGGGSPRRTSARSTSSAASSASRSTSGRSSGGAQRMSQCSPATASS